ncbi:MAG: choice-of-anchor J domain-containing protein, partial [Bacteroidales bacterium]|nr:choice-of-anchor J domain-containing protein [Bacteroidales bacterium]
MKKTFTFFAAIIQAIVLLCLQTLTAQTVLFHEDFEGGVLPAGWTVVDADGDGYGWETGSAGISGHNSTACFFSRSWLQETSAALTPDNWLITPAVTLTSDATLSFWVCAQDVNYAAEHYGVYISTTGTATTDFTLLYEETLDANGGAKAQGLWKQKTVDLSEYTGQTVRIAFRHFDCTDQFVLNLDDVEMVAIDPIIATNPSTINFGDVLLAHSKTVIVDVSTYSLTNIVTINTSAPFSISIDGTIYDTIVSLPASGGNIYVQYTPSTIGTDNGTVFLSSDSVSLSIAISGNGVVCSMPKTLPFTEDFDDEEFPPVCWNLISQNEETWKNNYYVTNWAFCKWSEENKTEQLETCVLDLSQATHPVLRFDFMSNYEYVGWGYVDFKIYVSTDGGGTYSPTPIWELSQFGPFDDWTKTKAKVDLVAFAGQSAVKFKFSYEGQYCSVYFDNVEIKNAVVSPEMIVYVKQNASGTGDGSSWDNAMDDIVEAIGIASLLDGVQVWVATGTYYGDTTAASENAFTVVDGVNVYGGFAGVEPANYDLSLRDLEMNETILDGLNERRVLIQPVQYSNYHTIWDGFTIQNGRSTGIGGGAYIIRGMTLGHCRIHNNYSDASGGGVYIYNNARVADCRIYNNESSDCGGGLYANAAAVINSCIISNNVAAHQGGGIYANNSEVRNCLISNNTVSSGYNTDAIGGGVFSSNSTIINSTIVRNEGKGFYGSGNVINSIVWGNSDPVNVGGDGFTCSYSAIENGCVGEGNIHLMDGDGYRPLFVNPALVAGNTDATTSIDWHLQEGSVCINKGNNAVVTGNFDLDGTVRIKRDTVDLGCYESDYYNVSGDSTIYVNYTGVVYVTQTGAGNFSGNNWENAMSSLETAQVVALTHNAVVWVATGIYYGDTTATSENAFAMVEGVNVYGGFAGNEPEDYDLSLRDFEANATILDGQNVRRVLYGYEKTDVVWDGFTITNGNVGGGEGGGVYMKGDILLSNCVINNNSAGSGGGVYAVGDYRGKPEILSCEISNNVTSWPGAEYGGGLYVEDCFVKKCLILNNDAGSNGTGGGVYLWGNSKMRNCIISGNTARFGGGVSCGTGGTYGPSIINCLISNNSASEYDGIGGVRCYSKVIVNNSTIVSNKGGGLSASYDSLLLSNSIVWGNQTSDGISSNLSGTVFCSYSAVEDGAAGNQNILLSDAFHQAPLFVHPSLTAGASDTTSNVDWHLQQESPCINRGDNSVVTDSVDLDGTARIKRDTVDLGCYESDFYSNPVIAPNYSNVIYVTPNGAGTQTGEDWDNATSSLTFALSVAENSNADVWVAAGVYYGDTTAENAFTMRERVNVYGGFAGNEPSNYDLSLRDFDANATILDGQSVRRVLYQPSNFYMLTIWDGITIQNGQSVNDYGYGGGAYLRNNGLLRHCVVKNNAAWQGGGVYYSGSDYGYDGGELLSHCIIKNNTAVNGGGGICLSSWSYGGKVSHCIISNNAAASGGGIYSYCGWSNHVVSNCLISNNTADHSGGGVYDNNAIITNSTIVSNIADLGSGVYGDSDGILTNCIVWGNGADELNNVYGSITCSYSAVEGGFAGEQNILLSDYLQQTPKFVHPSLTSGASDTTSNVDWHLQQGSVCINRGNNSFIIDSIDLDGVTRIRRDTVDLGCYESDFYSNPIVAPNYSNVIYVTQNGAGAKTGEDWENATSSISFALVAARTYNADVWV